MDVLMILKAFAVGGLLCVIGQVLIDRTALTPARILTGYVVAGVALTALGVYGPLVDFAGGGATVPLTGFGYSLAEGVRAAVDKDGPVGALTGGLTATAGGIAAAVVLGLIAAGLSYGILWYIYTQLTKMITINMMSLVSFNSVWWILLIGFAAAGILTGVVGSAVSMGKYLKEEASAHE